MLELLSFFKKKPLLSCFLFALFFHVFFLSLFSFSSFLPQKIPPKKIKVKTIQEASSSPKKIVSLNTSELRIQEPIAEALSASKPLEQKPLTPSKPLPPPQIKEKKKPVTKKKPSASPAKKSPSPSLEKDTPPVTLKPLPPSASDIKKNKLKKALEESVQSFDKEKKPVAKTSASSLKSDLNTNALALRENSAEGTDSFDYRDELSFILKSQLKLPEEGSLKIKITLKRTGNLVKIEIIKAESSLNKTYVEKKIKEISFPPFSGLFKNYEEHTFSLTLTS